MLSQSLRMPRAAQVAVAVLLMGRVVFSHPIPDVPVRASFDEGGALSIQVEVDPRCFEEDPNTASSVLSIQLQKTWTETEREELKVKAKDFIQKTVELYFDPGGKFIPEFKWEFTTHNNVPLKQADDIVVLTGTWKSEVPEAARTYHIRAVEGGKLSVPFLNKIRGKDVERVAVLFPGEESFKLDVADLRAGGAFRKLVRLFRDKPVYPASAGALLAAGVLLLARRKLRGGKA